MISPLRGSVSSSTPGFMAGTSNGMRAGPDERARRTRPDDGAQEVEMLDVLQVAGAFAILVPYVSTLLGSLSIRTYPYLTSNLVGGSLLAALALVSEDWGFLLLEGSWAVVAAFGLLGLRRSRRA